MTGKVFPIIIAVLGFALELAASTVPGNLPVIPMRIWWTYLTLHMVASALYAFAMVKLLPPPIYVKCLRSTAAFFVLSCLFVPVLGFLGVLVSVVYALTHPVQQLYKTWKENPPEKLPPNPRDMLYTRFGTGALRDILLNSPSTERRVEAITSVSRLPRSERIAFYRQALRDPADDVRLLAYSQLDPMEQEINDNIRVLEDQFEAQPDAESAFDIAQQFWELCYLGISEGVLFAHYIEKARQWCLKAIELNDLPSYELLYGRILLRQGKAAEARRALIKAESSRMLASQVEPYLAECAYIEHDYDEVCRIAASLSSQKGSRLGQIHAYWSHVYGR